MSDNYMDKGIEFLAPCSCQDTGKCRHNSKGPLCMQEAPCKSPDSEGMPDCPTPFDCLQHGECLAEPRSTTNAAPQACHSAETVGENATGSAVAAPTTKPCEDGFCHVAEARGQSHACQDGCAYAPRADLERLIENGRLFRLRAAKSPNEPMNIALSANDLARIAFALRQLSAQSSAVPKFKQADVERQFRYLGFECIPTVTVSFAHNDWKARDDFAKSLTAPSATAPTLPDIEPVAERVHNAWRQSKIAIGVTSRKSEDGEELMAPYRKLSQKAKELDRATVRAVYDAIHSETETVGKTGPVSANEALRRQARLDRAEAIQAVRAANNGKWPEQLESGVLFFRGERITRAEFDGGAADSGANDRREE